MLSRDTTAPTVTVGVYYHIGFRIEPRGRTGFAHLFEHLMFQGSGNLGKMEFIRLVEGNGGVLNGSTRFDFTNYYQIVPAHVLETVLWAEADRMKALAITQANLENQQGVVKNEVRDNVMNQPYGGFPWLTMPQVANTNWYNAHNFYGDLADLDAATLEDAKAFFDTYYAPNNAVLVVAGDFDPAAARAAIAEVLRGASRRGRSPRGPTSPSRRSKPKSGIPTSTAWLRGRRSRSPGRRRRATRRSTSPSACSTRSCCRARTAGCGRSWCRSAATRTRSAAAPTCSATSSPTTARCCGCSTSSTTRTRRRRRSSRTSTPRSRACRPSRRRPRNSVRALTKLRASLYDLAGSSTRFGLVDLLACFALFDDDPARINRLEADFRAVSPELIRDVARTYLTPARRTMQVVEPGRAGAPATPGGSP